MEELEQAEVRYVYIINRSGRTADDVKHNVGDKCTHGYAAKFPDFFQSHATKRVAGEHDPRDEEAPEPVSVPAIAIPGAGSAASGDKPKAAD